MGKNLVIPEIKEYPSCSGILTTSTCGTVFKAAVVTIGGEDFFSMLPC
jgi:hypothetical protein